MGKAGKKTFCPTAVAVLRPIWNYTNLALVKTHQHPERIGRSIRHNINSVDWFMFPPSIILWLSCQRAAWKQSSSGEEETWPATSTSEQLDIWLFWRSYKFVSSHWDSQASRCDWGTSWCRSGTYGSDSCVWSHLDHSLNYSQFKLKKKPHTHK